MTPPDDGLRDPAPEQAEKLARIAEELAEALRLARRAAPEGGLDEAASGTVGRRVADHAAEAALREALSLVGGLVGSAEELREELILRAFQSGMNNFEISRLVKLHSNQVSRRRKEAGQRGLPVGPITRRLDSSGEGR